MNKWRYFLKKAVKFALQKDAMVEFGKNAELVNLYKIFSGHPEGKWILGKPEALTLFNLVKARDPKNILELGTGIGASTAVLALAAKNGKVTSVEQYKKCVSIANEIIPVDLKCKITLIYSEPVVSQNLKISKYYYFSGYKNLPVSNGPFDFVIMDGPGGFELGGEFVKLHAIDIANLLPFMAPGCIVFVDGRKSTVKLYKRFLSDYLKPVEENQKYTLLERTAKPLKSVGDIEIVDSECARRPANDYF